MTAIESDTQLRPTIANCLRQYARRQHALSLLRTIGQAIAGTIVWLTVWGVIDRFMITIPSSGRLFLLIVLILWVAHTVRPSLARFLRQDVNWLAIATEIESRDARFHEGLLTVVSESLAPPGYRASAEMTDQLASRVESEIRRAAEPASPATRPARLAAGTAGIGLAVFISLFFWPRLGMQELIARQLLPLANLAPVKTTQLNVETGSADVQQGDPFTITASVKQLRGSTVILRTTTDNRSWSAVGMTPMSNGLFAHTLPTITRDLTYYVTAGDASSEPAIVRVLRHPLVRDFRIHLVYPKYVARDPLNIVSTDGAIQAPARTHATIVMTATEPLSAAVFVINGRRIDGKRTADARAWQVEFDILQDGHWQVEMLSDRNFPGAGPGDMPIHAIPDRAPIARLLMPEQALLLHPEDSVLIPYQAADDYSLEGLEARISVNNAAPFRIPLRVAGDSRRAGDSFPLDLSKLNVSIGDLVTATVAATDRAPQTMLATACQVLVSSQRVTAQQRRRVAQLRQSVQLAGAIARDLDAVQPTADGWKQADSRVSSAGESAAMLAQSLLGADEAVEDEQLAQLLAVLADAATVQSARLEQLRARIGAAELPQDGLALARQGANELHALVRLLWQGLSAEVIIAEQAALAAARVPADASVEHLREDVGVELHDLEIDPQASLIPAELHLRTTRAQDLMKSVQPIEFARLATAWAASENPSSELLSERLSMAAQIEAIRTGGNPEWARDLRTASRAVRAVDGRNLDAARTSVADAIALIDQEHKSSPLASDPRSNDVNQRKIRADASDARQALRLWSNERPLFPSTEPSTTTSRSNLRSPGSAATQESDTREQMLAAIRHAQEKLAELPLQLGRIEQSVQASREAQNVARQSDRDARAAPIETRAVAQRAADIARMQSDESFAGLSEINQEIDVNELHDLIQNLGSFGDDASSASATMGRRLEPALAHLRERIDGRDSDGIDQAIIESRAALTASQDELRRARQTVLDKDPLVAARWFTQQVIGITPASRPSSTQPQNETLTVLGRTWDDSLRRATEARFNRAPSTQPALGTEHPIELFEPGNSLRPWLDPDLTAAGAREDDPPQFKEALRAYFKVMGRPDSEVEP